MVTGTKLSVTPVMKCTDGLGRQSRTTGGAQLRRGWTETVPGESHDSNEGRRKGWTTTQRRLVLRTGSRGDRVPDRVTDDVISVIYER